MVDRMALFDRLRNAGRRKPPPSKVGMRRPSAVPAPPDTPREDALRARLAADPNDAAAFAQLAEIVRRRARDSVPVDPLTAPQAADVHRAANLAVWSLAEELAGNPRGWYPLVELARLSLADDHEAALRRLASACERDPTGRAVAEGVRMLREARLPNEALGLGVGHWSPQQHVPDAGRHIVLAALDAGRPAEARRYLTALTSAQHQYAAAVKDIRNQLEPLVADAEEVARTAFMTETGTVPAIVVARQEGSRAPAAPTVPDPSTGTGTTPV
jgi:hypothetical protein